MTKAFPIVRTFEEAAEQERERNARLYTDWERQREQIAAMREMLATAGRQLDKAAWTISHTDSFRAKECWEIARKCTEFADGGSPK